MQSWLEGVLSCSLPQSYGGSALRIGIAGCAGSGKTSLLRQLVLRTPTAQPGGCRSVCYAPYGGPAGLVCRTWSELTRSVRRSGSVSVVYDAELYCRFLPYAISMGRIMLIIDEAHEIYPRRALDSDAARVLREGRNRGVGLVWATQRPTACHTDLLSVSSGVILGRLIGLADMRYSSQWGVAQPLPLHEFRAVLPGHPDPLTLRSTPRP